MVNLDHFFIISRGTNPSCLQDSRDYIKYIDKNADSDSKSVIFMSNSHFYVSLNDYFKWLQ